MNKDKDNRLLFKATRPTAILPTRGTVHSAGWDLAAAEHVECTPQRCVLIPTGISVQLPKGYYGRLALRSGWSTRNHVILTAGVIDRDYKGEIYVAVICMYDVPVIIEAGTKFAQLIIEGHYQPETAQVIGPDTFCKEFTDHPGDASRHDGWGSTGS